MMKKTKVVMKKGKDDKKKWIPPWVKMKKVAKKK